MTNRKPNLAFSPTYHKPIAKFCFKVRIAKIDSVKFLNFEILNYRNRILQIISSLRWQISGNLYPFRLIQCLIWSVFRKIRSKSTLKLMRGGKNHKNGINEEMAYITCPVNKYKGSKILVNLPVLPWFILYQCPFTLRKWNGARKKSANLLVRIRMKILLMNFAVIPKKLTIYTNNFCTMQKMLITVKKIFKFHCKLG